MGGGGSPAATRSKQAYDYDLVCVGSGPAGQRAAVKAAKIGKRAVVIEKQPCLGGVCLGTGTIPSKTLREAVLSFNRAANRDRRGTIPSPPPDRGAAPGQGRRGRGERADRHRGPASPQRRGRRHGRGVVRRSAHPGGPLGCRGAPDLGGPDRHRRRDLPGAAAWSRRRRRGGGHWGRGGPAQASAASD